MKGCTDNLRSPGVKDRKTLAHSSGVNGGGSCPRGHRICANKPNTSSKVKIARGMKQKTSKRIKSTSVLPRKEEDTLIDSHIDNDPNDRLLIRSLSSSTDDHHSKTQNGKRLTRERLSSCDELKDKLRKHKPITTSSARTERTSDLLHVVSDDVSRGGRDVEVSVIEKLNCEPTSEFTASRADLSTDFERFVMENQNADFTEVERIANETISEMAAIHVGPLTDLERFASENKGDVLTISKTPAKTRETYNFCDDMLRSRLGKPQVSEGECASNSCDIVEKSSSLLIENDSYSVPSCSSAGHDNCEVITRGVKNKRRQSSPLSIRSKSQKSTFNLNGHRPSERLTKEFGVKLKSNGLSSSPSGTIKDGSPSGTIKDGQTQINSDNVSDKTSSLYPTRRNKRRRSSLSDGLDSGFEEPVSKSKRAKRSSSSCDGNLVIPNSLKKAKDNKNNNEKETSLGTSLCNYENGLSAEVEDLSTASQGKKTRGDEDMTESDSHAHLSTPSTQWFNIPEWMYVAVDCEMVGTGPKGRDSVLGRCSIVDFQGNVVYDKFVCPEVPVTDYRTRWSGIRPSDLRGAILVSDALKEIEHILSNKIIVGHSVYNDFRALKMNPPFYTVRDTAQSRILIRLARLEGRGNSLKKLSAALLDRQIQVGSSGHCSVEDARATLDLFKLVRQELEAELYLKWSKKFNKQILNGFAAFIQKAHASRGLRVRADSNGDSQFLNDEYWPSDVTDHR